MNNGWGISSTIAKLWLIGGVCISQFFTSGVLAYEIAQEQSIDHRLPSYTKNQAKQGAELYRKNCAACHGDKLNNGSTAPPLLGDVFYSRWGGQPVGNLLIYIERRMPPGANGVLDTKQYTDILAYIFMQGGMLAGSEAMSTDIVKLHQEFLPVPASGVIPEEKIEIPPPPSVSVNPLDDISTVTDQMLIDAPASDWLMWRRTYDATGFSPLNNITSENVNNLQVAWTWSMPSGRNITTPLVHDGVLFMYAKGAVIHALDAKTGDLLWRHERVLQGSVAPYLPRAIAIYGDKILFASGDGHVVALDIKTGEKLWDKAVLESNRYFSGGPLVVNGRVLLGTSTASLSGRNFIVALDANTGEEAWRFYTVAQSDDPGGDTWNNLGDAQRSGAGVWTPGSYDPEQGLAFFGTGNTYISAGKLRQLAEGASSNHGLYMNSTLALNPDSGKLAWYYQHLPNDQWNYDWAFERTLVTLPINGKNQKVLLTGGKPAIFDALNVDNGTYQFSFDLGLQNVIESIDPQTGAKKIATNAMPEAGKTRFVCPSSHGARNWMPTALNPQTHILYIPFLENCMKVRPPKPGDLIVGDMGQRAYPRPNSDGNFGGLKAVNLLTQKTLWTDRRRAIPTTGALATAGGLTFMGSLDRTFTAYQQSTGKQRWQVRLNDVPGGGPISFMVDGKQYIAVTTGHSWARNIDGFMAPEIQNPQESNATIWVFELRDQ